MAEYQQLYRMFDKQDQLLYVGISKSALARFAQHAAEKSWIAEVVRMQIETVYCSREEILEQERDAIIAEKPLHNKTHSSSFDEELQSEDSEDYDWTLQWAVEHPSLSRLWEDVTKAAVAWVLEMEVVARDEYGEGDWHVARNALLFLPYLVSKLDVCRKCRSASTVHDWGSGLIFKTPFRARRSVHQYFCMQCGDQWIVGYGTDYRKQPAALMSQKWLNERVTFRQPKPARSQDDVLELYDVDEKEDPERERLRREAMMTRMHNAFAQCDWGVAGPLAKRLFALWRADAILGRKI